MLTRTEASRPRPSKIGLETEETCVKTLTSVQITIKSILYERTAALWKRFRWRKETMKIGIGM